MKIRVKNTNGTHVKEAESRGVSFFYKNSPNILKVTLLGFFMILLRNNKY